MKYTCIIADDNLDSLEILCSHIAKIPELVIVGKFTDGLEVQKLLVSGKLKADILFLDIKMPGASGPELAGLAGGESAVVFLSGHPQYGPISYDLGVADYKLKPVFFDKFKEAFEKAKTRWAQLNGFNLNSQNPILFIPGNKKGEKIRVIKDDILYIKGGENYSFLFVSNGKHHSYITLKELEAALPIPHFLRIQKSYMVNVSKIIKYNSRAVFLAGNIEVPIGPTFKPIVEKVLNHVDFTGF